MILSTTCKAAIKAVIYLASRHEQDSKANIREIALEVGENEHTVAKLLQTLAKQDVIMSLKGPSGGFYLSKKQYGQPLLKVAEAIDGKNLFNTCGLGLKKCSKNHPCPIHFEYQVARDVLEKLFATKKISDLSSVISDGNAFLCD